MNIIQIIVSSIRVNILKLFYKKKKDKIKKLFNDERLFEKEYRLNSASIIVLKKKYVLLNSKKILIILFFYILVKKIFNIKKIYY